MKRLLLILLLISSLAVTIVEAQSPDNKNALSYQATVFDYYSPFIDDLLQADGNTSLAAKIAYHRNLAGPLNLEIPFRLGGVRLPDLDNPNAVVENSKFLTNIDALLQLQLFKENSLFVPFLSAGVGGVFIQNRDMDFQIPLGVGLDLRVTDGVYLEGRSEYRISTSELESTGKNLNNLAHSVGIKAFIKGKGEKNKMPADRDGDGISDLMDECPDIQGVASTNGCPDMDKDGIKDESDKCPDVAGEAAFDGCPDSDGDTVPDSEDKCPDVAGLAKFGGCPDTDNDGIEDAKDSCPKVYGVSAFNGCPDTDGDGIEDAKDQCPSAAGKAELNGCPDSDGDGIADGNDECPNQAGDATNNGCPVKDISDEDKKTLEFAAKNIQFKTNSSYLKEGSLEILDQVAEILLRYPDYKVNIDGYTDSAGKDTYNQWLSERRAERCYNYLLEKGIAADRMKFTGYGEANPIADNNTESGREQNRRVEFNLYRD